MSDWSAPPAEPAIAPGEVHLWRIDQSAAGGGVREEDVALLSADERERMARYRFERDRRRFALRRAAVRRILGAYLRADPARLGFRLAPGGRPEVEDPGDPPLRFNVSHSEEIALVGVASGSDLGVDVEVVRPIADMDSLAREVFSPAEREAYGSLAAKDRPAAFFNGWTRKEAWLKGRGEGLIGDLAGFDVTIAPGLPPRLLRVAGAPGEAGRWRLRALEPVRGAVAAVAVRAESCRLVLIAP